MSNIRSSGVYGDIRSGGGLLEGVPIEPISRRGWSTYFNDFLVNVDASNANWTLSTQGATGGLFGGSATVPLITQDSPNGTIAVFSTTADQGISVQFDGTTGAGAFLTPVAGRTIVWECAMTFGTSSNADCSWFAGLMPLDTTPVSLVADATLGTPLAVGGDNMLGFNQQNNTTAAVTETTPRTIYAGTALANQVRTNTGKTITDGTIFQMGIRLYGMSDVSFYWGTRSTGTTEPGGTNWNTVRLQRSAMGTALAAGTKLTPTFYIIANSSADVSYEIDYLFMAQSR